MVAELIQPGSRVPSVPTFGGSPFEQPEESSEPQRNPEQPGESSGSRRTPEQQVPERSNVLESSPSGRQAPATSGLGQAEASGPYDRQDNGASLPGQGRQEQARSTSPQAIAQDEKVFARYFTRGSQGAGEVERANVLREMERGNLEMAGPADHKEKWTGQNVTVVTLPVLPQVASDEKGQVHVRTLLERWESRVILHFNTISPRASLYAKA
eukprot:6488667-Amphidinium_carterae.1